MGIAVLGWGSLVWCHKGLRVKWVKWKEDGPKLPVEFARISNDNRLTLVLYPEYTEQLYVPVLWNCMDFETVDEAIENLRIREGPIGKPTDKENIGYTNKENNDKYAHEDNRGLLPRIKQWANEKGIDSVIWTDLLPKGTTHEKLNEEVIAHLTKLEGCEKKIAEEYVRKAPRQIRTPIREKIEKEKELGWTGTAD